MDHVGKAGENMYEVIKYINEHIHEKLTLESISRRFGYSKWYFCGRFKSYTGMSFVEYVQHIRIQRAALDLMRGKKVIQVALDYGYDNPSGLNKAFFKIYGCMPTEFKKNAREYQRKYEERKKNMYQLSDRCSFLREQAVNQKPYNDVIRGKWQYHTLQGILAVPEEKCSHAALTASAIASVIANAEPILADGELIVGYNYGDGACEFLSGEKKNFMFDGFDFIMGDADDVRQELKKSGFTDAEADWFIENHDPAMRRFRYVSLLSDVEKVEEGCGWEEWAKTGDCTNCNHSVIGYKKVLELGFEGLLQEVERYEAINGASDFYDSVKTLCAAGCEFGKKYARHAEALMQDGEVSEERKRDLQRVMQVCAQVPAKPARTFHEALQSLWFAHIINTWEDNINANSLGRLDQILYPYYKRDVESGLLTKEDAFELICCLWIKLYRDYDVQQSCVGGCDAEGNDAVNELSYMMLDATEALDFVRCLSVRYSKNTDKAFLKRAFEVVGHLQKGIPFFFNDDVMIPALTAAGVELADARDYTMLGCIETTIPGKSNPHAVSGKSNLLKALEYALADGRSMFHPELTPGIRTGELAAFTTYEELESAVYRQIEHMLDANCHSIADKARICARGYFPKPYKSLLTEGCVETGRDFNNFGAKYDYYQVMLAGIPNLADSLTVIKKFVYDTKKYTLCELYDILEGNFENEATRLEFINKAPKFGNDLDEVDHLAAKITNYACECLEKASETYGLRFHAQPFSYLWMIEAGSVSAASADGRRKGEIIAYSTSPMQGRDFNGVTALLNSLAKLPTTRTPGTTSAIVEIEPILFSGSNIDRLVDIFVAASRKGLCNVQFNTVDEDTLLDAQRHPDRHANLAVRVSGFSQKFNLLDKTLQDHIIHRTKHSTL